MYRVLQGDDSPFFAKIQDLLALAEPDNIPSEFGSYRRTNQFFVGRSPKLEMDYNAREGAICEILSHQRALDCILSRAKEIGLCLNDRYLAITGPPQINRYKPGDRIGWHVHVENRYLKDAVLSVIIVLSDSSSMSNSLEVINSDKTVTSVPTPVGSCTIMSACLKHRVTISSYRSVIAFDLMSSLRLVDDS